MTVPLDVVKQLFDQLEAEEVRHAVWKGSQGLAGALAGEKDVDLLVARSQASQAQRILEELGYRRFDSQPWARHDGVEDWIGFDAASGELVHIHLYHQLIAGKKRVEEYHLPWEDRLLDTAIRDPVYGVRISDPSLEIILLGIRAGFLASASPLRWPFLSQGPDNDVLWTKLSGLRARVDEDAVRVHAEHMLGEPQGRELASILVKGDLRTPGTLRRVRSISREALASHRRFSRPATTSVYLYRSLLGLAAKSGRRLGFHTRTKKRLEDGGAIVAIIGCDGSGKSTISRELVRWLTWKIEARSVYLGSGDGDVGLPVSVLKSLASRAGAKGERREAGDGQKATTRSKRSLMKELGAGLLALSISNERRRKVRRAHRSRGKGEILITDRYPQMSFPGIYDGPRLARRGEESAVRKFFAELEEQRYEDMAELPPDVVVRLHVPLEVALGRKPGHDAGNIMEKAELTGKIDFPGARVVDLDGSAPVAEVLGAVKRIVWESI